MRLRADVAPSHLYVPELGPSDSIVSLSRDESHYLHRVCRARIGDVATATEGRGCLARDRLVRPDRALRVRAGAGSLPIRLADGRLRCETAALAWALWWGM